MVQDSERADDVSRQRGQIMPFLGLAVLLAHGGSFFAWDWEAVAAWQMGIWTVLAIAGLGVLMTGGRWLVPGRLRALADDEVTRANRSAAIEMGFLVSMLTAIVVFLLAPLEPLTAQRGAHLVFSLGLASALIAFGAAEGRSVE